LRLIKGSLAKELTGREKPVDWHPKIDEKIRTIIPRKMLRNFIVGRHLRKAHAKIFSDIFIRTEFSSAGLIARFAQG
jgi:hypothetical protein